MPDHIMETFINSRSDKSVILLELFFQQIKMSFRQLNDLNFTSLFNTGNLYDKIFKH